MWLVRDDEPHFLQARRRPLGSIGSAVRESWVVQAERCRTAVERALPDAGIEIYFNLGITGRHVFDDPQRAPGPRAAWIVGPHSSSLLIAKETRHCDIVGVRLRPGTAQRVLGVPAGEIGAAIIDLDAFWGSRVESIRDQLAATSDPVSRMDVLERAIASQLAARRAIRDCEPAQAAISSLSAGHGSIGDVARAHGLSHRRLIALVEAHVGLKPKVFQRVQRLRRVLHWVHSAKRATWAKVALECGYYDQSHLINDFEQLAGVSPAAYQATRSSIGRGFVPHRLARA